MLSALDSALDRGAARPRLDPRVEIGRFTTRWGERYTILHSPRSGAYLRLGGPEGDLAAAMDGTRSISEIVVGDLGQQDALEPQKVYEIAALLEQRGLLERGPYDVYAAVGDRLASRRHRVTARVWSFLRNQTIPIAGAHRFTAAVYRRGGRWLFHPLAVLVSAVAFAVGLAAFVVLSHRGTFTLSTDLSPGTAFAIFGLGLIALFCHEMGHALAVVHARRRIIRAGFQLYLAHPAFFIDSTDVLLAPRRARAVNAAAGPYAEAVVASLAAAGAWLWPDSAAAPLLYRLAGVTYLFVLLNLIPFIELDGYWLLTDVLDLPGLRPRAFAVLRHEVPARLRRQRGPFSRAERGLATFAVVGLLTTVAALYTAWLFWGPVIRRLVGNLWDAGLSGRAALVLLLCLVLGPLAHGAGDLLRALARTVRSLVDNLRFRLQTGWRVEAAERLAGLPLARDLTPDALNELAGFVQLRSVRAGATVVRQGEAADGFYLLRRGRCAVIERGLDGEERVLHHVVPGEAFGELALLDGTPRVATVRAEVDGQLFVVDAGTFHRLLAAAVLRPDRSKAVGPLAEVWALPPFRQLSQGDAAVLTDRGEWLQLGPGEVIVSQGDPGDAFYVVGAGQVEVVRDGAVVTTLTAGSHFGELALLNDAPRVATVRTRTPVRLFRMDRDTFRSLLATTFSRAAPPGSTTAYDVSGAH